MKINSHELLDSLMADVREIILAARQLEAANRDTMHFQPDPSQWSIAQVLSHLNFYSDFYLKAIEEKLHHHSQEAEEWFVPGWFGNYFTKMMKPDNSGKVKNKMKAFKAATPSGNTDGQAALQKFISDQHALLNLLQVAKAANLDKIRVPTSLTRLIKLKLGDTFRFFIAHEQRHFVQIKNILASLN